MLIVIEGLFGSCAPSPLCFFAGEGIWISLVIVTAVHIAWKVEFMVIILG